VTVVILRKERPQGGQENVVPKAGKDGKGGDDIGNLGKKPSSRLHREGAKRRGRWRLKNKDRERNLRKEWGGKGESRRPSSVAKWRKMKKERG